MINDNMFSDLERLEMQMQFITEVDKMKSIMRRTLITDKTRNENDAEHSFHIALMAMTLYEYCDDKSVDLLRVLKMLLVHDLVEIYAGDTFAYDPKGNLDKLEREMVAAERIFGMLPSEQGDEYKALWEEFDAEKTADALFATCVDRLQPLILNYMSDGKAWKDAHVTAEMVKQRMSVIGKASKPLYEMAKGLIKNAQQKGYLI